jgi:hypothetical protein
MLTGSTSYLVSLERKARAFRDVVLGVLARQQARRERGPRGKTQTVLLV